ncbi:hypothetical protein J2W43_001237 [Pseudomonas brassicacearum]|uniref:Transposase n=1 Tax=Pseudomonas brassicacearum TaxID=930166 RepID=A0AAW8M675_9PSED|nr:hypothetical protein [Pseudomonas brassicacearum]UZE19013.1 hypothetical protein LOY70_05275 [Pseudomonas sp. B21-054]
MSLPGFSTRSAGTSPNARKAYRPGGYPLGRCHICEQLHVLDIPDDYRFMDPELVDMLELAVTPYLCI